MAKEGNGTAKGSDYTPTERRMLAILGDGLPHLKREMLSCLNDDLADESTVEGHLINLRKKLRHRGRDVLGQYVNNRYHVRLVRLHDPNDGLD